MEIIEKNNIKKITDYYYINKLLSDDNFLEIINIAIINHKFKARIKYNTETLFCLKLLGYEILEIKNTNYNDDFISNEILISFSWLNINNIYISIKNQHRIINDFNNNAFSSLNIHKKTVKQIITDINNKINKSANNGNYHICLKYKEPKIKLFIMNLLKTKKYDIYEKYDVIFVLWKN